MPNSMTIITSMLTTYEVVIVVISFVLFIFLIRNRARDNVDGQDLSRPLGYPAETYGQVRQMLVTNYNKITLIIISVTVVTIVGCEYLLLFRSGDPTMKFRLLGIIFINLVFMIYIMPNMVKRLSRIISINKKITVEGYGAKL